MPPTASLSDETGGGDSSFDFRFSARGGKNAVGEELGVIPLFPEDTDELLQLLSSGVTPVDLAVARPPLFEPFLNLECT